MLYDIKVALSVMRKNPVRALLSVLGIAIGTGLLVLICFIRAGTGQEVGALLSGALGNTAVLSLYDGGEVLDFSYSLSADGIEAIKPSLLEEISKYPGIRSISLFNRRSSFTEIRRGLHTLSSGSVSGVSRDFFDSMSYRLMFGRGFVEDDYTGSRKVAILDRTAARSLFPDENAVGKVIELQGEPFTVIGIIEPVRYIEDKINDYEDYIYYVGGVGGGVYITETAWPIIARYDEPQNVALRSSSPLRALKAAVQVIERLNLWLCKSQAADSVTYGGDSQFNAALALYDKTAALSAKLLWAALVALAIGAICIANLMSISVTERSWEIGLRIAMGASRRTIILQFLTETSVLTLMGGIAGAACAMCISALLRYSAALPSQLSIWGFALALLLPAVLGALSGLAPALRAAEQNPGDLVRS